LGRIHYDRMDLILLAWKAHYFCRLKR